MAGRGLQLCVILGLINGLLSSDCLSEECHFDFVVRWSQSMASTPFQSGEFYKVGQFGDKLKIIAHSNGYADGSILIGAALEKSHVITADGHVRNVVTINGKFPGPDLHVTEGSMVTVRVQNELDMSLSIHWHGIYQKGTPWMDGVGMMTQCPIMARQSFTYRFRATPSGTHWYHGHTQELRLDGLYGFFIVHKQAREPTQHDHLLAVQDWDQMSDGHTSAIVQRGTPEMTRHRGHMAHVTHQYLGTLVNGRGRMDQSSLPLAVYHVKSGQRYRFRVVNAGATHAYRMGVDRHVMTVVAMDGYETSTPRWFQYVYLYPGETLDVEVAANKVPGQYWIRLEGEMLHPMNMMMGGMGGMDGGMDGGMGGMNGDMANSTRRRKKRHGSMIHLPGFEFEDVMGTGTTMNSSGPHTHTLQPGWAILSYINSSSDPQTLPRECTESRPCPVFGCAAPRSTYNCTGVEDMVPVDQTEDFGVQENDTIYEHFLNFGFSVGSPQGSSVNNKKFVHPNAPMYQVNKNSSHIKACPEPCTYGCACTHILKVPAGETIQLVFANLITGEGDITAHHPIHLHGYGFAVMKVKGPDEPTRNTPDIACLDPLCTEMEWKTKPVLNQDSPVIKDTLLVPVRGYAVVRFRSDNPGYWFLHCHQQQHLSDGMAMILQVGEPEEHPSLPFGFPRCPSEYDVISYVNSQTDEERVEQIAVQENISITKGEATGIAFGLFLLGAVTATILLLLLRHFRPGKRAVSFANNGHENISFK